jgi:ABC-type sugar transport system ATPase subunit
MAVAPLLEIQEVSKSFAGTQALSRVSLTLAAGEVHALVGENGAGKSTLVNIIAGVLRPDEGAIRIGGEVISIENPRRAQALGIGMVFQELSLVESLTVAENVFDNRAPARLGLTDWRRLNERTRGILALLGLAVEPTAMVADLPVGKRQLVEIAKALSLDVRILILDEPTSALAPDEVESLFTVIRRLRAQGIGVIYITHRMAELFAIADRVTVLRDGHVITSRATAECDTNAIIRAMVGRDLEAVSVRSSAGVGAPLLEARGLSRAGSFESVDLTLHVGEIVGLAGLMGAHRTDLGRTLVGALPQTGGQIRLNGNSVRLNDVGAAMRNGIAYVTDDRKADGLFLDMSIAGNVIATTLRRFSRFGLINTRAATRAAQQRMAALRIKAPDSQQLVARLSGGNQQKVMLAKGLEAGPRIFIIDEPTKGVDIGAKREIHQILRGLADASAALLVISSDLPELLQLCDRILVMREGRLVGELDREAATEETVMTTAAGLHRVATGRRIDEPRAQ